MRGLPNAFVAPCSSAASAHGHLAREADEVAVMPEYVLTALAELAAEWDSYDLPGDTDETGRAA